MQREKVDFLLAIGEKLCRITGTESTEQLARVRSGDKHDSVSVDRRWDDAPEEYIAVLADMVRKVHPRLHWQNIFAIFYASFSR